MNFDYIKQLGQGKEGEVWVVKADDRNCVMKQFKKTKSVNKLKREAEFQAQAAAAGITPAVLYVDEREKRIFMDGIEHRLIDYVKQHQNGILSEEQHHQILNIMNTLDNLKILHNDGNCRNLMINNDGKIYIIDYGFSRKIDAATTRKTYPNGPNVKYTMGMLARSLRHNKITHQLNNAII